MIPIGTRARFLRNCCIASIAILGFFMVVFGGFLGWLATFAEHTETAPILIVLFIIELLFGGLLAWQITLLVLIQRCPEDLISQEGDYFRLYVKKTGYMTLPCAAIVAVKPVNAMLTAGWIGLLSGRYDATLEITATNGQNYRVPFVRLAQQTADTMMRIAYEVRMRNQIQASQVQAQQVAQPPVQPTDEQK